MWLAGTLDRNPEEMRAAIPIWERILHLEDFPETRRKSAEHELGLAYMGTGRYSDAKRLFRGGDINEMNIQDAFNYGMAFGEKRNR